MEREKAKERDDFDVRVEVIKKLLQFVDEDRHHEFLYELSYFSGSISHPASNLLGKMGMLASSKIIQECSEYYHIPVSEIVSRTRKEEVVLARRGLILAWRKRGMPVFVIGEYTGLDHTAICNATLATKKEIEKNSFEGSLHTEFIERLESKGLI